MGLNYRESTRDSALPGNGRAQAASAAGPSRGFQPRSHAAARVPRALWRWLSRASGRRRGVDGENGEVLRLDDVRREQAGSPHDVPELPHVPGPLVAQQDLSRRLRDGAAGAVELRAGFREKNIRQLEDVVSLPQRRQRDDELVEAIVDV